MRKFMPEMKFHCNINLSKSRSCYGKRKEWKISGALIRNQNKKTPEIRQKQHLDPNEKYINKISRIQKNV